MTRPSLHTTFDTSLVDVQRSFSSTETNTSGSSGKENQRPPDVEPERTTRCLETAELYSRWAPTYDSDGNFLQCVDDAQTKTMIQDLLNTLPPQSSPQPDARKVLDVGCGTGRSTTKLLQHDWGMQPVTMEAWDISPEMLSIARSRCEAAPTAKNVTINLRQVDFLENDSVVQQHRNSFDAIVSTLVLEHMPLQAYFVTVAALLKPSGQALVTNMHPDMGTDSVAGFYDEAQRLVGTSYLHQPHEVIQAARGCDLGIVGEVKEVSVTEDMIERGIVGERARKWIGKNVWFGLVLKKT